MFHVHSTQALPAPEHAKGRRHVRRGPALQRPAPPVTVLREHAQPGAARVHAHCPCARHDWHFLPIVAALSANCGSLPSAHGAFVRDWGLAPGDPAQEKESAMLSLILSVLLASTSNAGAPTETV